MHSDRCISGSHTELPIFGEELADGRWCRKTRYEQFSLEVLLLNIVLIKNIDPILVLNGRL